MEKELIELKHKFHLEEIKKQHYAKMIELKYIRETEKLKHDMELEKGRIRNADIKRSIMLRQQGRS